MSQEKTNPTNTDVLKEALEERQLENEKMLEEGLVAIKEAFSDEKQIDIVFALYQQVQQLSGDLEEINNHNLYLSSYLDAFYTLLVGEGLQISEQDFVQKAQEAYTQSIQQILEATKAMQGGGA